MKKTAVPIPESPASLFTLMFSTEKGGGVTPNDGLCLSATVWSTLDHHEPYWFQTIPPSNWPAMPANCCRCSISGHLLDQGYDSKSYYGLDKKRGPGGPVARPESSGSYDNLLPFLVQLIIPHLVYKMKNVGKYSILLTGRTDPLLTGWQKAPLHPPPRLGCQKNRHLAGLEGQLLFCRAGRNRSPLVGLVE